MIDKSLFTTYNKLLANTSFHYTLNWDVRIC